MTTDGYLSGMRANIWKLYGLRMVGDYLFMMAVVVPFWQHWGLTLGNVFMLQSVYAFTSMLCNIPSGYLADRWGRKNTTIAGAALGIAGTGLYCMGHGLHAFLLAEMILGVRVAMYSGMFDALLYESLAELGRSDEFRKIAGHQRYVMMLVNAACAVAGGVLAQWSLRATAWVTLVPIIAVFLLSFTLTEPRRRGGAAERTKILPVFLQCLKDARIRGVMLLFGVLAALAKSLTWFLQPYQQHLGVPLGLFGISSALLMLANASGSRAAHPLSKRWNDRSLLAVIALTVTLSYVCAGIALSVWLLPFFFIARFAAGAQDPIVSDIINAMPIKSARATVLSVQSFLAQLLFAVLAPLLGYLTDVFTLPQAILYSGLGGLAVTVVLLALFIPAWQAMPAAARTHGKAG
jgi:MFS family permease